MKDKLILNDGATVELEPGASLSSMQAVFADKASMIITWDKFTADNLKTVQIKNGENLTAAYNDLLLVSETSLVQEDGTILTSFHLREKTEMELLKEEVAALKEGQAIHDGAIMEVAAVVSVIAEAQEGGTQ